MNKYKVGDSVKFMGEKAEIVAVSSRVMGGYLYSIHINGIGTIEQLREDQIDGRAN